MVCINRKMRRVAAYLLTVVMVLTLAPVKAAAHEEDGMVPAPDCICDTLCVEGDVNMDCPVCAVDFTLCEYEENDGGGLLLTPDCICDTLCVEGDVNADCLVCAEAFTLCEYEDSDGDNDGGGGGLLLTPGCICEELCDEDSVNADCPVCAENFTECGYIEEDHAAEECDCDEPCHEGHVNTDCPVCAENPALCVPALLGMIDPMAAATYNKSGTHAGITKGNPNKMAVNLFTMYKGAYMNYLVYTLCYPGSESDVVDLSKVVFDFDTDAGGSGSTYVLEKVANLNTNYPGLTSYDKDVFYHDIKGDKNGDVIVFTSGNLKGLIVHADTGSLFISGYPNPTDTVANTAADLAKIKVNIDSTGATNNSAIAENIDVEFTFKFATKDTPKMVSGGAAAPSIQEDWINSNYAVSHGYTTIKNSDVTMQYAAGMATGASKSAYNISTWYPGTGKDLIIPFMVTNDSADNPPGTPSTTSYYAFSNSIGTTTPETGRTTFGSAGDYKVNYAHGGYDGNGEFNFQKGCTMLSRGGFLSLSVAKETKFSIYDALAGTFGHLRITTSSRCVATTYEGSVEPYFTSLDKDGDKIDPDNEPVVKKLASGEITNGGVKYTILNYEAIKPGRAQSSALLTFDPGNSGCSYWNGGTASDRKDWPYSCFVMINVLGQLEFETNEDGTGGKTEAQTGGKYYVQKLVEEGGTYKWVTQPLTTNPAEKGKVHISADSETGLVPGNDGSKDYYTVAEEGAVNIDNLDLGTGYRVVYDPGEGAELETSAFFTPPKEVKAKFSVNDSGTTGKKGVVTVDQQYGGYKDDNGGETLQQYSLQKKKQDGSWEEVTDWYNTSASGGTDNGITVAIGGGKITFTGLDENAEYQVLSRMEATKVTADDDDFSIDEQDVSKSTNKSKDVTGGYEVTVTFTKDSNAWTDTDADRAPPALTLVNKSDPTDTITDLDSVPNGQYDIYDEFGYKVGEITVNDDDPDPIEIPYYTVKLHESDPKGNDNITTLYVPKGKEIGADNADGIDIPEIGEGWGFKGWKKGSSAPPYKGGSKTWNYTNDEAEKLKVEGPLDLYAVWQDNRYNVTGKVIDDDTPAKAVPDAVVELKQGDEVIAKTVTDGNGEFTLRDVPDGTYNLVVTGDDGTTVTTVITIKGGNEDIGSVVLPLGMKNTIVNVAPGTPKVVVGGLPEQMDTSNLTTNNTKGITQSDLDLVYNNAGKLTLELIATGKTERNAANGWNIRNLAGSKNVFLYIDFSVFKFLWNDAATATSSNYDNDYQLTELQKPVTVYLPLERAYHNKSKYYVYRYHNRAQEIPEGKANARDGEYFEVNSDRTGLILTINKFSTYAVAAQANSSTSGPDGNSGSGGGGGGSGASLTSDPNDTVIINNTGNGGSVSTNNNKPSEGDKVTVTVKPNDGFMLGSLAITDGDGNAIPFTDNGDGTYTYTQPKGKSMVSARFESLDTGISNLLNTDDHFYYVIGRGDNKFWPDAGLTRAETAQMFYNLLRNKNIDMASNYSDVPADAWYASAVGAMTKLGVVTGYPEGDFRPNAPITRAEFATVTTKFATLSPGGADFIDVPSTHWAYTYIKTAVNYGWISGVGDGSFQPERNITRAEAVTLVNRALRRVADMDFINSGADMVRYTDASSHWGYADIMEASNTHDYERAAGSLQEKWSKVTHDDFIQR